MGALGNCGAVVAVLALLDAKMGGRPELLEVLRDGMVGVGGESGIVRVGDATVPFAIGDGVVWLRATHPIICKGKSTSIS